MQIKGIKVEWTQTFEHHCISLLSFVEKFKNFFKFYETYFQCSIISFSIVINKAIANI